MKVILIHLPLSKLVHPSAQMPIGVMYLASIISKHHEVIIKNYVSKLTYEAIADLPEADFYGVTATVTQLPQVNRFCYLIKEKYRKAVIGVGGPGTNLREYIDWDVVDTVCVGEGEEIILKMLEDVRNKSLQKVYVGPEVKELDSLIYPSRQLMNPDKSIFSFTNEDSAGIITSRGCPFSCDFCASPKFRTKMRYRSAVSVYDEIKHVIDTFGIRQFRFIDDVFTLDKSRVLKICEMVKELGIIYRVVGRVDTFDEDIARALVSSGCIEIEFGVESFDDDILKLLNKRITAKDNVRTLKVAHDCGLRSRMLFMVRTPGQTSRTMPLNIDYLERIPYFAINCFYFIPIPGSAIWYNQDKYGIEIFDKNIEHYDFWPFNKYGERPRDVFRIVGRDMGEVNRESDDFFSYLESVGKLHKG
jgi:anaerobic magnesium-protoporphyrin IX monomethyl ester cyclase